MCWLQQPVQLHVLCPNNQYYDPNTQRPKMHMRRGLACPIFNPPTVITYMVSHALLPTPPIHPYSVFCISSKLYPWPRRVAVLKQPALAPAGALAVAHAVAPAGVPAGEGATGWAVGGEGAVGEGATG
jgi:hypothetical protein